MTTALQDIEQQIERVRTLARDEGYRTPHRLQELYELIRRRVEIEKQTEGGKRE